MGLFFFVEVGVFVVEVGGVDFLFVDVILLCFVFLSLLGFIFVIWIIEFEDEDDRF